jgi:hypothetical protein
MSEYVLGAKDREGALTAVMDGDVTERPGEISAEAQDVFFRMQDFLVRMGIEETPQFHVAGRMVKGGDLDRLREILDLSRRRFSSVEVL